MVSHTVARRVAHVAFSLLCIAALPIRASLVLADDPLPGEPVTVQFGSYLLANAPHTVTPFGQSNNFPAFPYEFTRTYAATPFADAGGGQLLAITGITFFAVPTGSSFIRSNLFNVPGDLRHRRGVAGVV